MPRQDSSYTVGEIKALIGPLAHVPAEDVTGYLIVVVSNEKQRMVVLNSGDSAYDRIVLLSQAIANEAMEARREGHLWASAMFGRSVKPNGGQGRIARESRTTYPGFLSWRISTAVPARSTRS